MQIGFSILMFVLGAALGSFLCCQARRLRLKETKKKSLGSRSVCLHCKYQLKWYDNVPILSWLFLRGKCRKCHRKIGTLEILSELSVAVALLILSLSINIEAASPWGWLVFIINALLILTLAFLAIYDGAYGELPTACLIIAFLFATALYVAQLFPDFVFVGFDPGKILTPLAGALLYGGIYLVLYLISKGKWVGDGDWILAGTVGLALGSPWSALLALCVANLSATIIMLPSVIKSKSHKIYFGPFLVLSYILIMWYNISI